jgi:hypothetical protein
MYWARWHNMFSSTKNLSRRSAQRNAEREVLRLGARVELKIRTHWVWVVLQFPLNVIFNQRACSIITDRDFSKFLTRHFRSVWSIRILLLSLGACLVSIEKTWVLNKEQIFSSQSYWFFITILENLLDLKCQIKKYWYGIYL